MSWRGLISRNVNELRFLACPKSASSAGVRAYFENNYEVIKRLNPRLPVLLRNNDDASPYIIARYDFGERAEVSVADMTEAQIDEEVRKLVEAGLKQKRSAESLVPFELPTVTD